MAWKSAASSSDGTVCSALCCSDLPSALQPSARSRQGAALRLLPRYGAGCDSRRVAFRWRSPAWTVVYMVRGPVSVLFGVFIVLTLFQGVGFTRLAQPAKGVAMTASDRPGRLMHSSTLWPRPHRPTLRPALPATDSSSGWPRPCWRDVPLIVVFSAGSASAAVRRAHHLAPADERQSSVPARRHPADRLPAVLVSLPRRARDVDCRHLERSCT